MAYSIKLPVNVVKEMKSGKGITPIIDCLKDNLSIRVTFDGNEGLKLESSNNDLIDIAEEWLTTIHQKKSKKDPDPALQLDIKYAKIVWTFSTKNSRILNGLYRREIEAIPTIENALMHDETTKSDRLVLSCPSAKVSEVRPRIKELLSNCNRVKNDIIDARRKPKKAEEFCLEFGITDCCMCSYDKKSKKIVLVGKDLNGTKLVKEKWESFIKNTSAKHEEGPTTDIQCAQQKGSNESETVPKDDLVENDKKDKSLENKLTGADKSKANESTNTDANANGVRAEMEEPITQIDKSIGAFAAKRNSFNDPKGDAEARGYTDVEKGEPPRNSSYRKPNQQEHQPNEQQSVLKASIDLSNIVGPGHRERNTYVFYVCAIKVLVYKQSVVDVQKMDAIVNAANDHMAHAGGIAFFISKAAGKNMDEECHRYVQKYGPLKVTDVYVSTPGNMACKGIFHAVGPRWSEYIGQEDKCAEDLYKTIYQCLNCLDKNGWKNIAICAISSGIFGVPKQLCTAMYLKAIEDFATQHPNSNTEVHFIDVNQEILDLMKSAHMDRLKVGRSPDFKYALIFPSAKKGYPGHTFYQRRNRQDRGCDETTGKTMHGQSFVGSYKYDQPKFSRDEWKEYKPEKVPDVAIDIEKYCKLSSKKPKATQLQVENISEGQCAYCSNKKATKKFPCGHRYCDSCSVQSKTECQKCKVEKKATTTKHVKKSNCPICMEDHDSLAILPCSHEFCKVCLKRTADEKPVCPICSVPFGIVKGTQPDGKMSVRTVQNTLPGYASVGTIEIRYDFKDGKQKKCHPDPGKGYSGITRTAYLPDNAEGQKVLQLLKKAFSRKLVFTIGDSRTTGQKGQITWNDIHHKTTPYEGGRYGYPDETYLSRIQEELAAKGITE